MISQIIIYVAYLDIMLERVKTLAVFAPLTKERIWICSSYTNLSPPLYSWTKIFPFVVHTIQLLLHDIHLLATSFNETLLS